MWTNVRFVVKRTTAMLHNMSDTPVTVFQGDNVDDLHVQVAHKNVVETVIHSACVRSLKASVEPPKAGILSGRRKAAVAVTTVPGRQDHAARGLRQTAKKGQAEGRSCHF